MHPSADRPVDPGRRALLATAARGLVAVGIGPLLASCSGGEDDGANASGVAPTVAALFSPYATISAGRAQRFPFAVIDPPADLADDAVLPVTVSIGGETVTTAEATGHVITHDHVGDDVEPHTHPGPNRYFVFEATLPEPGIYDMTIDVAGTTAALVVQAFGPDEVAALQPGDTMPPIVTPTFDDPGTIETLCTRLPDPCPFHAVTVADAVSGPRPLVVLVTSPAVCRTTYCGPTLAALLAVAGTREDLEVIHLEAFENAVSVGYDPNSTELVAAPALTALGLDQQPSLFVVASDGVVVARLDSVFDEIELRAALDRVS